jgi:hypothetical protein
MKIICFGRRLSFPQKKAQIGSKATQTNVITIAHTRLYNVNIVYKQKIAHTLTFISTAPLSNPTSFGPMPPKVIGKDACLQARGPFRLSEDFRPKRCMNILRKDKSKEIRDSMKMEEGGLHYKKYDGHCTK